MKYGVIIKNGARPWQIFQQNNGSADISLKGEYSLGCISQELPMVFEGLQGKKVNIKARIAREDSGESVINWQECEVLDECSWQITFRNVPAGGLYRIETYMDFEGWNGLSITRGDMVHHIGVGDVFVIAGQSNAAGRAKNTVYDNPELGVHLLRNSGEWDLASHPLNETTNALFKGHFENHNPGHCPYLHFAKILKKELGYPIGLVNCAYGGSPLRWWNPDENGALFDNMRNMLGKNNISPKGILWYQGEADAFEKSAETYLDRFGRFVRHLRQVLGNQDLPVFTVQLNKCTMAEGQEMDRQWGMIREAQRQAAQEIPGVYVVPSTDLALYDFIHNSSESNLIIGERSAKAALSVLYSRNYNWRAPEAVQAIQLDQNTVSVELSGIMNWINTYEVIPELLPFTVEDKNGMIPVIKYQIEETKIRLSLDRAIEGEASLHGAWKMNCGSFIPCDCMRLPMLSFYGLKVSPAGS